MSSSTAVSMAPVTAKGRWLCFLIFPGLLVVTRLLALWLATLGLLRFALSALFGLLRLTSLSLWLLGLFTLLLLLGLALSITLALLRLFAFRLALALLLPALLRSRW